MIELMDTHSDKNCTEVSLTVPWGIIAGQWYGDQLVRPILALHGWLDNCGTFARLAPLLAPHASILCIDLPGHGYSSHLPAGILYTNMEYVRIILRIMEAYNWEKVSLIGHSMSGNVGFHFASFYPDLVDILIGIDVVKTLHFQADSVIQIYKHIFDRCVDDNERIVTQTSMNEPPSYSYDECERLLYQGSGQSVDLENCKYILERNITKSAKYPNKYYFSRDGRVKYINEFNPSDQLGEAMALRICKAKIPHLVLKGGASLNASSHDKPLDSLLIEKNPHFELHEVPGGTHHLHLNRPEQAAELIIEFLQKYRPMEKLWEEEQNKRQPKAML